MEANEILQTFTRLLRDILLDDDLNLEMTTVREDVEDWDSFNYVNFMVAVEMELNIKFNVADIESFENVGDIVKAVQTLMASS